MQTALKKALREKALMSLGEAAKHLGVTAQTMSNWNTGKTPIKSSSLRKLRELGIPTSVLINPTKKVLK